MTDDSATLVCGFCVHLKGSHDYESGDCTEHGCLCKINNLEGYYGETPWQRRMRERVEGLEKLHDFLRKDDYSGPAHHHGTPPPPPACVHKGLLPCEPVTPPAPTGDEHDRKMEEAAKLMEALGDEYERTPPDMLGHPFTPPEKAEERVLENAICNTCGKDTALCNHPQSAPPAPEPRESGKREQEVPAWAHPAERCAGEVCIFHNPTDHPMRDWPWSLRETGLMERKCVHGIGHPDPDSAAWMDRIHGHAPGTWSTHGCDGCCHAEHRPAQREKKNDELVREVRPTTVVGSGDVTGIDSDAVRVREVASLSTPAADEVARITETDALFRLIEMIESCDSLDGTALEVQAKSYRFLFSPPRADSLGNSDRRQIAEDLEAKSPLSTPAADSTFKAEGSPFRRFYLWRVEDETGISRTGRVLEGVLTQSGEVIVQWRPPLTSTALYKDFDTFMAVHVTCHPSKNEVRWIDDDEIDQYERLQATAALKDQEIENLKRALAATESLERINEDGYEKQLAAAALDRKKLERVEALAQSFRTASQIYEKPVNTGIEFARYIERAIAGEKGEP